MLWDFQPVICTALLCFGEEILHPNWRDMFSYFDNIYRDDLIFLFVDVPVFIYMFISISVFLVFPFTVFCFFDL